jgi:hypothetical protein
MLFHSDGAPRSDTVQMGELGQGVTIGGVDSSRELRNVVCDRCSFSNSNATLTLHAKADDGSRYFRCASCGFISVDLLPANIEVLTAGSLATCISVWKYGFCNSGSEGRVCWTRTTLGHAHSLPLCASAKTFRPARVFRSRYADEQP